MILLVKRIKKKVRAFTVAEQKEFIHILKDENDNVILGDRTKTYSGQRTLNMNCMVIFILEKPFEEFIPNPNNLLFCREDGGLISFKLPVLGFLEIYVPTVIPLNFINTFRKN